MMMMMIEYENINSLNPGQTFVYNIEKAFQSSTHSIRSTKKNA